MGNISSKINLAGFKGATIIKSGKNKDVDCIIIPIEANHFFKSEKGAVYADFQAFELKNPKEGSKDTHIIKQSLPKEVFSKMSDAEKQEMPIMGNHIVWGAQGSYTEAAAPSVASEDDLPF